MYGGGCGGVGATQPVPSIQMSHAENGIIRKRIISERKQKLKVKTFEKIQKKKFLFNPLLMGSGLLRCVLISGVRMGRSIPRLDTDVKRFQREKKDLSDSGTLF